MSKSRVERARDPAEEPGNGHQEPPELSDMVTGLSRQNTVYRRTLEVCDELADAVLDGVDPVELTRVLADLVDKRIVLMDPAFVPRAEAGADDDSAALRWDRSDPSIDRLLRALVVKRRPLRVPSVPGSLLEQGCLITPIVVGDEPLGYLLVLDRAGDSEPDDVDLLTATYAATLFALTLAHERTSTELGLRYQRAIVDALTSGHFLDADDARQKARALGLDEAVGCRIGVVHVDRPESPRDVDAVARRLSAALPRAVVTTHESRIVLILPDQAPRMGEGPSPTPTASLSRLWERLANATNATVTCGLSEHLTHPEHAPHGLRQAEQAVDLGMRLGRVGQLVRYDDLGIYRLLLRIGDMSELWRFADDVLGPVIEYDTTHKLDLVKTLSEYLRHQGSLKQVSRSLHVHPNTVAYRAQRIEKLTGLDLADPDDRLLAHAAVKIVEAQRAVDT
ncbi:MAG: hypothetical protein GEV10_05605 [Streptosporangiales bacterium]|nr:hypothetical protein [Streptosporangiales bacterium]